MAENEKADDNKQQDFTKFLIMTIASIVIMFIVFAGAGFGVASIIPKKEKPSKTSAKN